METSEIYAKALRCLILEKIEGVSDVVITSTYNDLINKVRKNKFDIIITELRDGTGIKGGVQSFIKYCKTEARDKKIIAWTTIPSCLLDFFLGCGHYALNIQKNYGLDEIIGVIKKDMPTTRWEGKRFNKLSQLQNDIIYQISTGKNNSQICRLLGVNNKRFSYHKLSAMKKIGITSLYQRNELIRYINNF
ncbi:TPA: hypothetical protein ACXIJH_005209 [Serratia marcescens]